MGSGRPGEDGEAVARVLHGPVPQPPSLRYTWARLMEPEQDRAFSDPLDELTADEGIVLLGSQFLDLEP